MDGFVLLVVLLSMRKFGVSELCSLSTRKLLVLLQNPQNTQLTFLPDTRGD